MSILGTCPECLHHTDGMCDLRPRICLNYDHFERRPTVTLSRDVFETQYISRATFDAEVAALTAALAAANEDAARLASSLENDAYPFPIRRSIDEKDAALRAHRARVGGLEK